MLQAELPCSILTSHLQLMTGLWQSSALLSSKPAPTASGCGLPITDSLR